MHESCHLSLFNIPALVEWQSFLTEKARLQARLVLQALELTAAVCVFFRYFHHINSIIRHDPRLSRLRMVRRTEIPFVLGKNSECLTLNLKQIHRYDDGKDLFFPMP